MLLRALALAAVVATASPPHLACGTRGPDAGSATAGSATLDGPVVQVPMDLSTRHVALEVHLGREGPFAFNLDTYAVTTACVDRRFAERMKLEKVGEAWNGDGSGARRKLDIVLVPELRLGGATFRDVRALVDDYSWVPAPGGGAIDGLLGYHLFRGLLLELDYPAARVVLREGELSMDDPNVLSYATLKTRPDIPIRIGDHRIVVGIDSGADSALSLPLAFIERLTLEAPPTLAGRAKTVYSEADVLRAVLGEPLQLAGHAPTGVEATFSELFGKPLIGHELLQRYAVAFDQRNGRARFDDPAPSTAGQR